MEEKKYLYDKGDGTMVSRQRMHQIRFPDKKKALDKRYRDNNREKINARAKEWRDKFEAENGISYYLWRKQKNEHKESSQE